MLWVTLVLVTASRGRATVRKLTKILHADPPRLAKKNVIVWPADGNDQSFDAKFTGIVIGGSSARLDRFKRRWPSTAPLEAFEGAKFQELAGFDDIFCGGGVFTSGGNHSRDHTIALAMSSLQLHIIGSFKM